MQVVCPCCGVAFRIVYDQFIYVIIRFLNHHVLVNHVRQVCFYCDSIICIRSNLQGDCLILNVRHNLDSDSILLHRTDDEYFKHIDDTVVHILRI